VEGGEIDFKPTPSLRAQAKQSMAQQADGWIASAFARRASADTVVASAPRNDDMTQLRHFAAGFCARFALARNDTASRRDARPATQPDDHRNCGQLFFM
jgi:hypothetical protein